MQLYDRVSSDLHIYEVPNTFWTICMTIRWSDYFILFDRAGCLRTYYERHINLKTGSSFLIFLSPSCFLPTLTPLEYSSAKFLYFIFSSSPSRCGDRESSFVEFLKLNLKFSLGSSQLRIFSKYLSARTFWLQWSLSERYYFVFPVIPQFFDVEAFNKIKFQDDDHWNWLTL